MELPRNLSSPSNFFSLKDQYIRGEVRGGSHHMYWLWFAARSHTAFSEARFGNTDYTRFPLFNCI